jgi:hypothetical protein|nr:MAG TPA: hypothetical protein [Caudoviricetes sp.]
MNSIQQNLKINYKHDYSGMSCMTVFDGFGQMLNQINDEEAEYIYNSLVGNPDRCLKELRKENKDLFMDALKSRRKLNPIIKRFENKNQIIVITEIGTITYSKLRLTMFWLTHSNDDFYMTFGFSWVPDSKLQDAARNELNKNMIVGIDFAKEESYHTEVRKMIFPKKIDLNKIDEIHDLTQFTTEMFQKGFRN